MDLQLEGKRALITGASRGLGYATARTLALEACLVVINSRDTAKLESAADTLTQECGHQVFGVSGDVTKPGVAEYLAKQTVEKLGGIDLLVTNTGGPPAGRFDNLNDDDWRNAFELNMLSHVRLIRAALPELRKSTAASVLTITSFSIKQPIPNLILSNSLRAATVGMTKSLALELGGEGIRFNSILPAWTETERVHELMANRASVNGTTAEMEFAKQAADSPMKRMGRPQEFANAAVFLLSPAASYITGLMLSVDGGMYKATY